MTLTYTKGDATQVDKSPKTTIICHICNDVGAWGAGFVMAISRNLGPRPEMMYRIWAEEQETTHSSGEFSPRRFERGLVQLVRINDKVWVANMVAQEGLTSTAPPGNPPIRYGDLDTCLERLYDLVMLHGGPENVRVQMPRIGCGLAGGKWERIEPLIQQNLTDRDIEVTVFDFDPKAQ